jgi:hypothetical protein
MLDEDGFEIEEDAVEPEVVTEMLSREQFLEYQGLEHDPNAIEDIRWAYQALGAKNLRPEDAPSPGAWFIYATTQDNDLSKKAFITSVVPKLLPNKAQMEKLDRAEDGRKQFDLIDGLLREPDDLAPVFTPAERRARQLALSPTGA